MILIGIVVMVIFLVTSSAGRGDMFVLLAGAAISAIGLLLRRKRREPPVASGRFQTLRRLMGEELDPDEEIQD